MIKDLLDKIEASGWYVHQCYQHKFLATATKPADDFYTWIVGIMHQKGEFYFLRAQDSDLAQALTKLLALIPEAKSKPKFDWSEYDRQHKKVTLDDLEIKL